MLVIAGVDVTPGNDVERLRTAVAEGERLLSESRQALANYEYRAALAMQSDETNELIRLQREWNMAVGAWENTEDAEMHENLRTTFAFLQGEMDRLRERVLARAAA